MKRGVKAIVAKAEQVLAVNNRLKLPPPDVCVMVMNLEARRRWERNGRRRNEWRKRIVALAKRERF